ncbi:hypothetical protein KGF54_003343 [Candida jiufengensis]|uniref:uncharacterized protein n=1 Tax=Candida jiufengensis TaxID=497108 RepID=UPI0022259F48|nr:uncharacterized protein KGF54_003343 [Candida jiufengensis]KAI5952476.1 hypothetical protein KGF54_003343 [Candida jiufengensis]
MSKPDKPLSATVEDLVQLRAIISQFQATYKSILEKSPTPELFEYYLKLGNAKIETGEAVSTLDRLKGIIETPQIKVAVRIRQLGEAEKLPFLTGLLNVNFKAAAGTDQTLQTFLDIIPTVDDKTKKLLKFNDESTKLSTDYYSYPPTLPLMANDLLLVRICTDKSYRRISDFVESKSIKYNNSHNAKLAIRGRSIMDFLLLEILEEKFPNLYENDLVVIRSRLMSSEQLAKFAFGYNLVDSMKYNLSSDANIEEKMVICGNIFLSYIAGLQMENYDLKEIKLWLKKLYEPLVIDLKASTTPIGKIALIELENLFKSITNLTKLPFDNIKYEIVEVKSDPHLAHVLVGGEVLGVGVSSVSFEDAKDRAVLDVMDNQNSINKIFTIMKESYLRNRGELVPVDHNQQQSMAVAVHDNYSDPHAYQTNSRDANTAPRSQYRMSSVTSEVSQGIHEQYPYQQNSMYQNQMPPQNVGYQQSPPPMQRYGQQPTYQQQPPPPQQQQQPMFSQFGQPQPLPPQMQMSRGSPHNSYQQINNQMNSFGVPEPVSAFNQPINCPRVPLSVKEINMQAKNDLYAILGPLQLKADYDVNQVGTEYHTICSCNGIQLGFGVDTSKKKSSQKSAMAALDNHGALHQLGVPNR